MRPARGADIPCLVSAGSLVNEDGVCVSLDCQGQCLCFTRIEGFGKFINLISTCRCLDSNKVPFGDVDGYDSGRRGSQFTLDGRRDENFVEQFAKQFDSLQVRERPDGRCVADDNHLTLQSVSSLPDRPTVLPG